MPIRRFAIVSPNFHPRTCGVGDYSMRLAVELQRRGHEVTIFSQLPAEPHPEAPGILVIGAGGPTPVVIAERLRRRIEAYGPTDLLIQYTPQMLGAWRWGSVAIPWLAAASRRAGINTVLVAHELFLPWRRRPDLALGAVVLRVQLALLMRLCDRTLVTMGTRLAEIAPFAAAVGLERPTSVVRIGANALPLSADRVPGRLRLGVFSTLAATKRFDVVLDCFRFVHARRPDAELFLLGDLGKTSDASVSALHAAIDAHPGRARIQIPGKLPLPEVARLIAELDVYLFPMTTGANTRSSTLPIALGAGIPTVAIRGEETDALFVDGENLIFADALTGDAFARAVQRLEQDPALEARVSRGAKALYDASLSWDRIVDQLLAQI